MGHFQVLFSGELVAGADAGAVRQRLAARLGLDERKLHQLFSGRTVVLRSELEEHSALEFQAELEALGARARIKDRTPVAPKAFTEYARFEEPGRDTTLKDITAAHFECPRCGFLQLEAEHCARCGVNIAQAMRERRKEDLQIERRIRELREQKVRTAVQHGRRAATQTPGAVQSNVQLAGQAAAAADTPLARAGTWLLGWLRPRR
jgi:ribosomal protein L37E